MSVIESFVSQSEAQLTDEFLKNGYVIHDIDRKDALDDMRQFIAQQACDYLSIDVPEDTEHFLNNMHDVVPVDKINDFRVATFNKMNSASWFRPTYFELSREQVELLVGNELAMQSRVNLSIQMPHDETSTLDIHVDTYYGESPFEVVQWVPLVDVYETKSMFLLPPERNREVTPRYQQLMQDGGSARVFSEVENDLVWLDVRYGQAVVFSPNLLHGNVVNRTTETRWSINCRLKGLFTPYGAPDRSLGPFFKPITTRVVSRVGMNFQLPEGCCNA